MSDTPNKLDDKIRELLIKEAAKARNMAYAPYSNYLVGAALIVPSGNIYTGCNIENASYGLSNCAERTAVFKAVSEGQRHIDAIAIVGAPRDVELAVSENAQPDNENISDTPNYVEEFGYAYPCGACRQVLSEFIPETGDMTVIIAKSVEDYKIFTLSELLPVTFDF